MSRDTTRGAAGGNWKLARPIGIELSQEPPAHAAPPPPRRDTEQLPSAGMQQLLDDIRQELEADALRELRKDPPSD
jgi:hypothetical protein